MLDVGPANGFFSFEMEKRGGDVTAIDLGQKAEWDIVPHPYLDEAKFKVLVRENVAKVENAFWFGHKALNSKVRLIHGAVYDVPHLIAETDIALMSNVLQHFRDPFLAIQRVSQTVKETLIITETLWDEDPALINSASLRLIPRAEFPEVNHSWWQVTPTLIMELVKLLGLPDVKCEFHEQRFNGTGSDLSARMVKHFTVTARRPRPLNATTAGLFSLKFAPEFHPAEQDNGRTWRWASKENSSIQLVYTGETETSIALSFGLGTSHADSSVTVHLNGTPIWSGKKFYGVRPVYIPAAKIKPGINELSLISSHSLKPAGHDSDQRTRSVAVFDLSLCEGGASAQV